MSNLVKSQKIVIGIMATIVVAALVYYIYTKDTINLFSDADIDEKLEVVDQEKDTIDKNNIEEERNSDDIIVVHIAGAVNKEGIVELKSDSRIADAIEKAGGLREDANLNKINLAYILSDGIKIYIPSINDNENVLKEIQESGNNYDTMNELNNDISNTLSNKKESKVNINNATQTELETLPGIGPSTALKIIKHREKNGLFGKIEDIQEVSGIGENKYNEIKELISIK